MSAVIKKTVVADVTNTLAKTTISDKPTEASKPAEASKPTETSKLVDSSKNNEAPKPAEASAEVEASKPTSNDAGHQSANEGRRLYIGNLAYATTEEELKAFFVGYLVESVSIPKNPRTDRPVGYAFVDLSTPSEAERAIECLSGKEVLERKVSVQLARNPEPAGAKGEANGDSFDGSRHRSSGRSRGRGRGRGGRTGRGGGASEEGEHGAGEAHPAESQQPLGDITNQAHTEKSRGPKSAPRPPRERKERGPPADGIASKTKVMVANLPYDLSEEKLKDLFASYEPLSAKIALRPIPRFMIKKLQARGEARKGRGFGFVTLTSEDMQLKAVAEMNGKEIEGREIAVKVAIDSPDKTDDEALHHEVDHEEASAAAAAVGTNGAEQKTEVKTEVKEAKETKESATATVTPAAPTATIA